MPSLFDPLRLGAVLALNRVLMAPLTRGRATREHVPTPIMAEYYAQRASAGLLAEGLPLAPDDQATWYSRGREGYLDYPFAAA